MRDDHAPGNITRPAIASASKATPNVKRPAIFTPPTLRPRRSIEQGTCHPGRGGLSVPQSISRQTEHCLAQTERGRCLFAPNHDPGIHDLTGPADRLKHHVVAADFAGEKDQILVERSEE